MSAHLIYSVKLTAAVGLTRSIKVTAAIGVTYSINLAMAAPSWHLTAVCLQPTGRNKC
jgi:predicted membrane-bound dolichyl-phosphate-mannose-protein mannosyltransferase